VNCSASDVLGTGLAGCRQDRKRVVALGLLQRGTKIDADVTKAFIQNLQQTVKLIYLKGVVTFADNTPENNYATADGSGIKSLISKMPYEFLATFDNGVNFSKALKSVSGHGNYDLVLFDVEDYMWVTQNLSGDIKGYTLGIHDSGKYMGQDGVNKSSQTLMLQLTERNEIDERMGWIKPVDFTPSDLDGVNDVTITIDTIANASTTIVFTPLLIDGSHLVEGLIVSNLKVTRNGATIAPSAISYVTNAGKVTLTVTANTTADVVTVSLNGTILSLDTLYKSNVATKTV
jgi:hypothetical protein